MQDADASDLLGASAAGSLPLDLADQASTTQPDGAANANADADADAGAGDEEHDVTADGDDDDGMATAVAAEHDFPDTDTTVTADVMTLLQRTCQRYAPYLSLEKQNTRMTDALALDAHNLLARIDEFDGLLSTVKAESRLLYSDTIPALQQTCESLETTFSQIDAIERFVTAVRINLSLVEAQVTAQENAKPAVQPLQKLKSLTLRQSKGSAAASASAKPAERNKAHWVPPPVFSTRDYFPADH